jgi:DNA-binding SARP family transcriptional activator
MSAEAAEVALLSAAGFDVAKVARHVLASESTVEQLLAEATEALGSRPVTALRGVVPAPSGSGPEARPVVDTQDEKRATSGSAAVAVVVPMQLQVLGGFRVTQQSNDITPPPGLGARLVKVLALADRRDGLPVDEVVDVLWPDADLDSGRVRLRNVLSRLRQSSGDLVVRDGDALRLAADVQVDLDRFEALAKSALVAHGRGEPEAVALARAALVLHGGLLLPDSPYDSWAAAPRERMRRRLLELLDLVAEHHRRAGRFDEAVRLMERAIEVDVYDEERYLLAAELRREQGRHGAALKLVEQARAVVRELGVSPSARLREIERTLRN